MNEIITYSLNAAGSSSDNYYEKIKYISGVVINGICDCFDDILEDFLVFQKISSIEKARTKREYGLEILTIGVLWENYIDNALEAGMSFFSKYFNKSKYTDLKYSVTEYKSLIDYINQTNEFVEEYIRLEAWYKYLINLSDKEVHDFLLNAYKYSCEFSKQCDILLSCYLPNLDNYLTDVAAVKDKQDIVMLSKNKGQYYLNMVGAQIMNDIFFEDFYNCKTKIVLLPGCMCLNKDKCEAKPEKWGNRCLGCTFNCTVNKISKIADEYDIGVYIINHESELYKNIQTVDDNIGIVGIACVVNLLSGGWKAKRIGFVPQCVLLDYCGCKHWHRDGIVTNINLGQLLEKLNISQLINIM